MNVLLRDVLRLGDELGAEPKPGGAAAGSRWKFRRRGERLSAQGEQHQRDITIARVTPDEFTVHNNTHSIATNSIDTKFSIDYMYTYWNPAPASRCTWDLLIVR